MTGVKVCGITRREDAELAVALGAVAIGFVFAPSPRRIAPDAARAIAEGLPPEVERVGVFVDAQAPSLRAIAAAVPLTRLQLHGDEAPALAAGLPLAVTRALRGDAGLRELDAAIDAWRAARPDVRFLLDLPKGPRGAESSAAADELAQLWERAAALARRVPLLLAGGLDATNVAAALARVRPAAIDVARGVEASPGVKDPRKLRELFAAVARFDREHGGMK